MTKSRRKASNHKSQAKNLDKDDINRMPACDWLINYTARYKAVNWSKLSRRIWHDHFADGPDQPEPKWPDSNDDAINGRKVVKVTFTPEARKLAHKLAEMVHNSACRAKNAGRLGKEYFESTEERRFRGMIVGIASVALVYDSWGSVYDQIAFGESDNGDVRFKTIKVDAKTTYRPELQVNREQFNRNRREYKAYISVYTPCDPQANITELLGTCDTAYILGYATSEEIDKVFRDYDNGRPNTLDCGVKMGRDGKPYCYISKLNSVDDLIKSMTKAFGKGLPEPVTNERTSVKAINVIPNDS